MTQLALSVLPAVGNEKSLVSDPASTEVSIAWDANLNIVLGEILETVLPISLVNTEAGTYVLKEKCESRADAFRRSKQLDLDTIKTNESILLHEIPEVVLFLIARGDLPIGNYSILVEV